MTDNNDDILVQRFFEERHIKIEDNGFTHSVMHRLPDSARRLNRIWTAVCAAIGIFLLVKINVLAIVSSFIQEELGGMMAQHFTPVSPYMACLALTFLLFVGGCGIIVKDILVEN